MNAPRWQAEDFGTAFYQTRPWLRTIDRLADAVRALLGGTGSKAELARTLEAYEVAGRRVIKEAD